MTVATLDTFTELDSLFHDLETKVADADYSETLEAFQPTIAAQEAGMFDGEYGSNLVSWSALNPSTAKKSGHDRILVETGALRQSLVNVGGPGNINATAKRGLLFGTDIECAIFHQNGTAKMPARSLVGLAEETLDKLCDRIADATVEIFKRR